MQRTIRLSPARPLLVRASRPRRRAHLGRALATLAGACALTAVLVAVTTLAAYGSRDPAAARRSVSGTYAVTAAGGLALPATVLDTGIASPSGGAPAHVRILIGGGAVTLTPGGTYTSTVDYALTRDGDTQTVSSPGEHGTYTLAGSTVTFRGAGGHVVATGTVVDDALTVSGDLLGAGALRRWCASGAYRARPF